MQDANAALGLVASRRKRLDFLKGNLFRVLIWPVLCLAFGGILWKVVLLKIDTDQSAVEKAALHDVSIFAHEYGLYVTQKIDQIDQITIQVRYEWEHAAGRINFTELSQKGVFRNSQVDRVSIVDRKGILTSLNDSGDRESGFETSPNFMFHKNDTSDILVIGTPEPDRRSGKPLISFTRRLRAADGSFEGMVLVLVKPAILTSFFAGAKPGQTDLLAAVGLDGIVRASRIGGGERNRDEVDLLDVPLFEKAAGSTYLPGKTWFRDGLARFVGWESLQNHPLVVVTGISEDELLAPHRTAWATYKLMSVAGSGLLLLFGFVAMRQSARLAWKEYQEEQIRIAYRTATESGNEGYYMLNAIRDRNYTIVDFKIADCNERGATFLGTNKEKLIGTTISTYNNSYFRFLMKAFTSAMESGFVEDVRKVPPGSRLKIEWAQIRIARSGPGLAVTIRDVSEQKRAEKKIAFLAYHDPLTALPNRLMLRERFEQARAIAGREESSIAMLFVDLDNFKQINDSFGHEAGDRLLIEIVRRLKKCIRETDTLSRQGGDEWIILLSNVKDMNGVNRVAQSVLDTVMQPVQVENNSFIVSASVGISLFPHDGADFDTLLKNADTAMYQAKNSGRNAYRFFTEKMTLDSQERLRLLTQLRAAISERQLELHYQPQMDLLTGKVIGTEALIRWRHPELGMVPPARFIPLAEESGLIIPIGNWVLQEACAQARAWQVSRHHPFTVAVNISALQFKRGDIVDTVRQALDRSGLPPSLIELELTESVLIQDTESTFKMIRELKTLGVKLSIDDFGTGYSSLSYLKQLKVDRLKIDQSFVRDITQDVDDLSICCAIIQLGNSLQLRVMAEGVETSEQMQILKVNGCHEAQGYYFSRPLPPEDASSWIRGRT